MTAQRADELLFEALPAGTPEERALALAFKRGERGAYEQIHERYQARVLSVCKRMLGDPDDAQEAAQEAFLRVYQGLPRFNGRYRLGAWIVRITTNVCLDQLRSRSRRPSDPAPIEILDLESPLAEDTDPQILFLRHAEGRRVRKVLDSLPPLHRAAIVLRDFEGIPYSDIAETLGITEGQVKALLHRARKGFKRSWAANMASMLLPAGLFKRMFKPWDLPSHTGGSVGTVSQAAESALSTSGQFAASAAQAVNACGGALHQCSQFMADKAAPVVAAVAVGAASVGGAVLSKEALERDAPPKKETAVVASAPEDQSNDGASLSTSAELAEPKLVVEVPAKQHGVETKDDQTPDAAEPPANEESSPPAAETAPVPDPSPAAEAPAPAPEPTPSPDPPAAPAPPAAPVWKLNSGSTVSSEELCACDSAPQLLVDKVTGKPGQPMSFHQVATGALTDLEGDPAWAMRVDYSGRIWGSRGNIDVAIDLTTMHGVYRYESSGVRPLKYQLEDGNFGFDFGGHYRLVSQTGPSEGMPLSGKLGTVLYFTPEGKLYNVAFELNEDGPQPSP